MKREQLRHNPAGIYLQKKSLSPATGTYAQEDELYHVEKQQNTPDSVWLDYIQSGVFCHILRFSVGCRSPPSPFQFTIHPLTPELKWRTSMFDKKSEYALNKHDQDSIIYKASADTSGSPAPTFPVRKNF